MTKSILVTHFHPDLDGLLGLWILVRFGGHAKYDLKFVPVGRKWEQGENIVHVDTGLIQFDHHQRSDFTCSAKLVYDSVFSTRRDPAVERLVDYALKTDWYLTDEDYHSLFALNSIIAGLNQLHPNHPHLVAEKVFELLDVLYISIGIRVQAEEEYSNGFEFDSIFGRAFGIESQLPPVREVAYARGAHIYVFVDPRKGYRGYKARSQEGIDFTEAYERIRRIEPDADWFLHSSRELLLCGSDKAPDRSLSKLPLEKLTQLVRKA